jgi:predicted ABC-class ATPase
MHAPALASQAGSRLLGNAQQLSALLNRLDGKGYKAYRDIQGAWQFNGFTLIVDHCQGDPYAAPSRLRVQVRMPPTQPSKHQAVEISNAMPSKGF